MDLSGRHALVCGASSGLGRATALALARRGATVSVLARRREALAELVPALQAAGAPEAHVVVADLDDREAAFAAVAAHLDAHGPVHILVNNAGGPPSGPLLEVADEQTFTVPFGRHVLAAHGITRLVVPGMGKAGYGRIVNIISTSVREPIPGLGISNLVRAAMASWAKTMSKELPPGITINSVLPGYTATGRLDSLKKQIAGRTGKSEAEVEDGWISATPEGRLGRPEELGETVAFLASPAAAFIRGVVLPVDGGRLNSI